jgi:hypothetical protein
VTYNLYFIDQIYGRTLFFLNYKLRVSLIYQSKGVLRYYLPATWPTRVGPGVHSFLDNEIVHVSLDVVIGARVVASKLTQQKLHFCTECGWSKLQRKNKHAYIKRGLISCVIVLRSCWSRKCRWAAPEGIAGHICCNGRNDTSGALAPPRCTASRRTGWSCSWLEYRPTPRRRSPRGSTKTPVPPSRSCSRRGTGCQPR